MGKNLTKQQQQIIVLLVIFIGGGGYGYWNFLLKPTLARIEQNEKKYEDLISKIEKAQRQARRLPALKNELEKLKVELADLEKQLPTGKDVPNIIRVLTREALRENLNFINVSPKKVLNKQYFEIIPFGISFDGSLHGLARFLASLGQQQRIFKAENITLTPTNNKLDPITGQIPLSINLTIQTYSYRG